MVQKGEVFPAHTMGGVRCKLLMVFVDVTERGWKLLFGCAVQL